MAVDDETGIDPASKDGEGASDDELAKRRGKGSVAGRTEALDGAEVPVGEEDDGQLFVWEQGRKVGLSTLITKGVPVEHAFVFGGKRVKGRGGLMALDEQPVLVVRGMAGPVRIVPTHDADGKVTKAVIEQTVNAVIVHPAASEEAVAMIGPILDQWRLDHEQAV